MNNRILSGLALILCISSATYVTAQKTKIRTVANAFGGEEININTAKYNIDLAYENPDTRDNVDMWCWRGIVYAFIGFNADTSISNMDSDAAMKAGESFDKYFKFPESSRQTYKEDADRYYTSAAILCFNKGYLLSLEKGNLNLVKQYMGYIETIINNDETAQLAAQNLTLPKVYTVILQSTQIDSNQAEEIIYLNKLIALPKYNNAYVFIRLSEIYTANKEYDKALEILSKGKEKIPSKANDFLNAEISLEIDRNNIESLITKFTEGIQQDPDNAIYYYNRGTTYSMLKNKELSENVQPPKYYFIQAHRDFTKCLELDPGNGDASFNMASLIVDSANYVYKYKNANPAYDELSKRLYKDALDRLEIIRQSGSRKDKDLVDMLKTMKSICAKLGDEENRKKYNKMYQEEETKLNNSN
jgi:tetratricopeptide (TPR) repeat protein